MKKIRTSLLFQALNRHQAKLSDMEIPEARQYFDKISSTRIKPKLHEISDIDIVTGNDKLKLRIYRSDLTNTPTIVYFHGGGFVLGSIKSHDIVARLLVKATKCSVVSVGYRLAPEYKYPAAIEDGIKSINWLVEQNKLRLNARDIFLAGDSAGGHIAVLVAARLSDGLRERVKGLILMYPALDPTLSTKSMQTYAEGYFVTKQNMEYFWSAYDGNNRFEWPMPKSKLTKLPPAIIQTAEHDILRDEGLMFSQQLSANGVPNEYHSYKDTAHGLMQMPTVLGKRSQALKDISNFVEKVSDKSYPH